MSTEQRRKCRLVNSDYKSTDLRQHSKIIIDTINKAVPGKNPKVFQDYFSTDPLSQGEAILIGRELAKIPELAAYGKTVTSFRLFDGKTYDSEESKSPCSSSKNTVKTKGGRMT